MAWPGGSTCNVEIIVTGNLIAACNVSARVQIAFVFFISDIGIRIATVIQMAIWITQENYLSIRIVTMVDALTLIVTQWCQRGDFSDDIDLADTLPWCNRLQGKDTQSFNR